MAALNKLQMGVWGRELKQKIPIDTSDLICYLRFNENLIDETGNLPTPSINGTYWQPGLYGRPGKSIYLNSNYSYINFADNDLLSFGDGVTDGDGFSFSFCFSASFTSNNFRVLSKRGDGTGAYINQEYEVLFNPENYFLFRVFDKVDGYNCPNWYARNTTPIIQRTLYHVCFVFDSIIGPSIYVNGIDDTLTRSKNPNYIAMQNRIAPLRIGNPWFTGSGSGGAFQGLGIWNRALTSSEISDIAFNQMNGFEIL